MDESLSPREVEGGHAGHTDSGQAPGDTPLARQPWIGRLHGSAEPLSPGQGFTLYSAGASDQVPAEPAGFHSRVRTSNGRGRWKPEGDSHA